MIGKYVWCFQKVPGLEKPFLGKIEGEAGYCWAVQPKGLDYLVKQHKGAVTKPYDTIKAANMGIKKLEI